MHQSRRSWILATAAAVAVVASAASARAELVTYTTVGQFGSSGTEVFNSGDVTITFNGFESQSANADPTAQISFGTFSTAGTTAGAPQPISDTFSLFVFQSAPTAGGPLVFVGSLEGTLSINGGEAFVEFAGPLSQSIGDIVYTITEADNSSPGRVNLVPPTIGNPPGVSSIEGEVSLSVIPEPTSVVMAALAVPALWMLRRRRAA
jgi:hypothetical protein